MDKEMCQSLPGIGSVHGSRRGHRSSYQRHEQQESFFEALLLALRSLFPIGMSGIGRNMETFVHAPELSDVLVIGIKSFQNPHELRIAAACSFYPPRRTQLIEIPVRMKLWKRARIVTWPTGGSGLRTFEAELCPIELLDKCVDDSAKVA
jgi:hypothetical protein